MDKLVTEAIRELLWSITKACLIPMDAVYSLIESAIKFDVWTDFTDSKGNSVLQQWWKVAVMFLAFAVIVRLLAHFLDGIKDIKKIVEEDLAKKLVIIIITIFLVGSLPVFLKGMGSAFSLYSKNIMLFFGGDENSSPSDIILTACDDSHFTYWVENKDGVPEVVEVNSYISIDEIQDINEKEGGVYKHFSEMYLFFICILVSISVLILMFTTALDVFKRWFEIIVMVFFSFIPISSLIDEGDGFKDWLKAIFFAYMSNFAQIFITTLAMSLTLAVKDKGIFFQIMTCIGGFLFAQQGSNYLARFMGIDTSGSTLQQLSQVAMVGQGIGSLAGGLSRAAKSVVSTVGGALGNAGNAISRTAGRFLGGVGLNNYGKLQTSISTSSEYGGSNLLPGAENSGFKGSAVQSFAKSITDSLNGSGRSALGSGSTDNAKSSNTSYLTGMNSSLSETDPVQQPMMRQDTYHQNKIWKDNSTMQKFIDKGFHTSGIKGAAMRMAGRTASSIYENSLIKAQRRRFR